jgi:hypothetical protein
VDVGTEICTDSVAGRRTLLSEAFETPKFWSMHKQRADSGQHLCASEICSMKKAQSHTSVTLRR